MLTQPSRYLAHTLAVIFGLFLAAGLRADEPAKEKPEGPPKAPAALENLKYRSIGPAVGGRVSQVAGVPGDPLVYYAATAAGGVWKSTDGGLNWKPVFDDQPVSACGSIAVAPSDPNVVYVGTGEANLRGNVAAGNGIYKSEDAGKTWKHVWKEIGHIGDMIVHPTNPDIAYAAVLGHAFGPNRERGVYRTTDGGKTWQRVLYKDEDTGASDVCFDPNNPRILFAGMWQVRRRPWIMTSGGPGGDLCVSRDGGDTWKSLKEDAPDNGLPEGDWGKIGVAVAPSDSRRVYALIEAEEGGLFRSDDGGEKWERVNGHRILRQRAWYFSTITVDPTNKDVVYFPQVPLLKSTDGGKTVKVLNGPHHVDHHHLWIDPLNPKRMITANDGGVDVTTNGGETWYAPPLPICQFYHIACDNSVPYKVMGCMQDMGTAAGPSHSLSGAGITLGQWHSVGGGEAGYAVPDPRDPNVVYAGEYLGFISRYDHRTRTSRHVGAYPADPSGITPAKMKYRFQWTAPILVSRHYPNTVYHAANVLFRSRDGGQSWDEISPDLTRDDESKQQWSGGPITGDNTGVETYCTIFALAESIVPKDKGAGAVPVLWAGTDDGLVHISRDNGESWENVTANIPGLPDWGTVRCIEASPHDPATAYLVVDAHRLDDYRPYLWKTTDYGKTWEKLHEELPKDVYLHVVREDPKKKGQLYLGTERGVMFSPDAGRTWHPLRLNMPTAAVHDLVVKDDDLVVGTMGRSIWILDDLTAVREFGPEVEKKPAHLFPPRPAVRWHYHGEVSAHTERGAGDNPEKGALIHYYLKEIPDEPIKLEILGAGGKRIAEFDSEKGPKEPDETDPVQFPRVEKKELPAKEGVNRFAWDLRHRAAELIPEAHVDWGDPGVGPLVAPGMYTVKLTVGGESYTAPLVVERDPRFPDEAGGEEGDAQEELALRLREDISRLSGIVKQVRALRKQLDLQAELMADADQPEARKLREQGEALAGKLKELERKLHNPDAEVTYDIFAREGGAMLYSQFVALLSFVTAAEGEPTQGMRRVARELGAELAQYEKEFAVLRANEAAAFNAFAREHGLPPLWLPGGDGGAAAPAKAASP